MTAKWIKTLITMFGDLADRWERAAADRMPVREIVGDDPVEFAETFAQVDSSRHWIDSERTRLITAMDDAERGKWNDAETPLTSGPTPEDRHSSLKCALRSRQHCVVPLEGVEPLHSCLIAGSMAKTTGNSVFLSEPSLAASVSFAHGCGQTVGKRGIA